MGFHENKVKHCERTGFACNDETGFYGADLFLQQKGGGKEQIPEEVIQSGQARQNDFVEDIVLQRKIGIFYHAVGLGDAGESAKGEEEQNGQRTAVPHTADASGDFQKASHGGSRIRACPVMAGKESLGKQIENIKQYHIAAQPGDAVQPGQDGVIQGIQKGDAGRGFGSRQNFFQPVVREPGMDAVGKGTPVQSVS